MSLYNGWKIAVEHTQKHKTIECAIYLEKIKAILTHTPEMSFPCAAGDGLVCEDKRRPVGFTFLFCIISINASFFP